MGDFERTHEEAAIVMVGRFFPLLLIPSWFVRNQLLPAEDVEEANIDVIIDDITRFSLSSVTIEVLHDRLVLRSFSPLQFEIVKDLAAGILMLLPESRPTALGINFTTNISCDNLRTWHHLGDTLTPKTIWSEAIPHSPRIGLKNLQLQVPKGEGRPGLFNFSVSWTGRPKEIQFSLNNHFDFSYISDESNKLTEGWRNPLDVIGGEWGDSIETYEHVLENVIARTIREA